MIQIKSIPEPDILLVEDNHDDVELVTSIFRKNNINHSILHLGRGEEALDYLFKKEEYSETGDYNLPKVIMLDINLPKMNGLDVLKKLRANQRTEHIPVFVFTSSASDYNVFESYRLGIASYIRKQTSFEKFEEAVMQVETYLREYRILILEDNETDAELIKYELSNSSFKCNCRIARNRYEYESALIAFKPDIIFSDYDLVPNFDAIQAIGILREKELKIPFVLVTGKLGEEFAASCLTEGMDDYLLKGQLKRFPVTLMNRLRMKKIEEEKAQAADMLRKSESELRMLFDSIDEVFFSIDVAENKITQISPACEKVFGYSRDVFLDAPDLWKQAIYPEDLPQLREETKMLAKGKMVIAETRIMRADGELRWVQRKLIPSMDINGGLARIHGVVADITERKGMIQQLVVSEKRVKDFSKHLNQVLEDERAFIAREMHDEFGQQLAALKLDLSIFGKKLNEHDDSKERLQAIMKTMDTAIQSMREIATKLRPAILDTFGLIPSIEWLIMNFEKKTGIKCNTRIQTKSEKFHKDISICFFRICQESLTNILKHAHATQVDILLMQNGKELILKITDNGQGFSDEKLQNPFSMGLIGMRERAGIIGGNLKITSQKDFGTTIYLRADLDSKENLPNQEAA